MITWVSVDPWLFELEWWQPWMLQSVVMMAAAWGCWLVRSLGERLTGNGVIASGIGFGVGVAVLITGVWVGALPLWMAVCTLPLVAWASFPIIIN
jgi:hypothetical protein